MCHRAIAVPEPKDSACRPVSAEPAAEAHSPIGRGRWLTGSTMSTRCSSVLTSASRVSHYCIPTPLRFFCMKTQAIVRPDRSAMLASARLHEAVRFVEIDGGQRRIEVQVRRARPLLADDSASTQQRRPDPAARGNAPHIHPHAVPTMVTWCDEKPSTSRAALLADTRDEKLLARGHRVQDRSRARSRACQACTTSAA